MAVITDKMVRRSRPGEMITQDMLIVTRGEVLDLGADVSSSDESDEDA